MASSSSCSCSHWWHAPFYVAGAAILAFTAISSSSSGLHQSGMADHDSNLVWNDPATRQLSLNASSALRLSGFTVIAALLQVSPELFFSGDSTTIFAIADSAISGFSAPLAALKPLLQYHASPAKLSLEDLRKKPAGQCLPTLLPGKSLVLSGNGSINNVTISHPDLFLGGPISVHGVPGPFSSFPGGDRAGLEFFRPPECKNFTGVVAKNVNSAVEWTRIVHLLSSNGFVSFAIGLHSVLDRIVGDSRRNLSSVTIFTPPEFSYIATPLPVLEKVVRFHIVPQRLTLADLARATTLRTLVPGRGLKVDNFTVNGVGIAEPEIFSSRKFVVYGISRVFETSQLFEDA